ncbi:MAG TPA: ferritin-like domain-containing protein [Solirubrobacteraceae bacterium]|nr:ferritin-like domain-containing protein [Solirubrobacteraceae bacterium]
MRVYEAILADFSKFKLQNKDYFQRALQNEKDHRAAWSKALGFKKPTGFTLHVPAGGEEHPLLLGTGVALEAAFVETHLGAVKSFSSTELKLAAAEVASTEATHFSFSDAAFGGHTVLPSFPGNIPASAAGRRPGRPRAGPERRVGGLTLR